MRPSNQDGRAGSTTRVVLTGWRPGLRKVRLGELIREHTDGSLARSKGLVDDLLEDPPVEVFVDASSVETFRSEARRLGARVE